MKKCFHIKSLLALTKKSDTLDPKSTVAGLGEAHWIVLDNVLKL